MSGEDGARDLFSSFRKSKVTEPFPPPLELIECVSCLDDFAPESVVKVPCHSYCFECFAALIATAVQNEQQWPPKRCLNEIPFRTILRYVPSVQKTFKDRSSEWNIPAGERVYCNVPDCSLWIKPDHIRPRDQEGRCDRGHWTCILCRGPRHPYQTCRQDKNLALTNQLAEEQGWKKCGKCNALVEHREACRHMTCRCGYQFCYVCGKRWCTCVCTEDMLRAIKDAAQTRRRECEARDQREAQEAEELRQVLAQIAEFEREEALKAGILRKEQERLEEERWQRELEERIRQEVIRRRDVELKFTKLREGLDLLHKLQHATLESQQEKDAKALVENMQTAKDQLKEKHSKEREHIEADIQAKMSEKDRSFAKDYTARLAEEKKIIERYQVELEAFWRNKAGGPQEIAAAMGAVHEKMKQGYSDWQGWKAGELEEYRERLEETRAIKEEYMYSEKSRMEDHYQSKETELVKRGVAEQKWLQMVIVERERLLGEMEMEEMEGDVDSLFGNDNWEEAGESAFDGAGDGAGRDDPWQAESFESSIGRAL